MDAKSGTDLQCSYSRLDIHLNLKGKDLNIIELPRSRKDSLSMYENSGNIGREAIEISM